MQFECPVCGREFNRKNNLNVHIKRHEKNRKFSCPECNHGFVMRAHVLKHLKKVHKIDEETVKSKYKFLFDRWVAVESRSNEEKLKHTGKYVECNTNVKFEENPDDVLDKFLKKMEAYDSLELNTGGKMEAYDSLEINAGEKMKADDSLEINAGEQEDDSKSDLSSVLCQDARQVSGQEVTVKLDIKTEPENDYDDFEHKSKTSCLQGMS